MFLLPKHNFTPYTHTHTHTPYIHTQHTYTHTKQVRPLKNVRAEGRMVIIYVWKEKKEKQGWFHPK